MSNLPLEHTTKRFRRWLANKLASWARRIYPESEEMLSFYSDRLMELVITGKSSIKVLRVEKIEDR